MEWVLRIVWTNFIQKLTLKLWNQVEFTKHIIQHCLVWLVMVWTSLQRISTPQLKWRSVIGYVFLVWEPILMDPKVTSTEWEAPKKLSDGTPNFMKMFLNKNLLPKEYASADLMIIHNLFVFIRFTWFTIKQYKNSYFWSIRSGLFGNVCVLS